MPQMMPINWIISLFFFIWVFILFNIMNYYVYINKNNINMNKINMKNKNFFWKW
uniref:ATP synthase complex subunit 8 n=1 Tax=Evergestis junctalis TaxID=1661354 RepID=A0A190RVN5_9NEOP|nr:ATP synthase F0 subunit 8 [Evergestis junctalis]AKJ25900.1 ATP synthase F0 subunit 8 [Evergestis junctalis]